MTERDVERAHLGGEPLYVPSTFPSQSGEKLTTESGALEKPRSRCAAPERLVGRRRRFRSGDVERCSPAWSPTADYLPFEEHARANPRNLCVRAAIRPATQLALDKYALLLRIENGRAAAHRLGFAIPLHEGESSPPADLLA